MSLLIITTAGSLAVLWNAERGVLKLKMPGCYKTRLTAEKYSVWNFRVWKSKGLELSDFRDLNLRISDEKGKRVPLEGCLSESGSADLRHSNHVGRAEAVFEPPEPGVYTVECDKASIVVIVPKRLEYPATSMDDHWIDFPGSGDDFNFVNE